MTYSYLLDMAKLKDYSPIFVNVDEDIIKPCLLAAQDMYLQNSLGTNLYQRLMAGVIADDLNADEVTLLTDYARMMLVHYTVYELLPNLVYKMANGDLSKHISDDKTTVDRADLEYMRNIHLNKAENYAASLNRYLCENTSKYPEYNEAQENGGKKPDHSNYNYGGLFLG